MMVWQPELEDPMTASTITTDLYREHLEREKRVARERLAASARQVISIVEPIARFAEHTEDPSINDLGELQSSGTVFDTACARYASARQALRDYDAFRAEAAR
jgi:hypothetical protein